MKKMKKIILVKFPRRARVHISKYNDISKIDRLSAQLSRCPHVRRDDDDLKAIAR